MGSTTLVLDLGDIPDGGNPQPEGCKGKIDFLFVISRDGFMATGDVDYGIHERLAAAFPKFFATIEAKFADFDYHILVTKGDPYWGGMNCNAECPGPFTEQCEAEDYPCEMVGKASACDQTWGAGVVFNAGWEATNKPCDLAGGKRYMTKEQPDPAGTFACIAQVGASAYWGGGTARAAAITPEINGPDGCNDGFLRDDALLMVTLVTNTPWADWGDIPPATAGSWGKAVIDAKGGDPNAVVAFLIGAPSVEWCEAHLSYPSCRVLHEIPRRTTVDVYAEDYAPAFDAATDLVEEACSLYIPG